MTDQNFRVPEKYVREILPILFHLHCSTFAPDEFRGLFSIINCTYSYSAQNAEDLFFQILPMNVVLG